MIITPANQTFHSFIRVMASLREASLGQVSIRDKKKNEKLWLRIQDFCLLMGGKNNAAPNAGNNPVCTQVFDALSKNKKEYDQIVKNIYMPEWDHKLVFQAIMSEYVPSNASGYLIAKAFRIPRSRPKAFNVAQGVCPTAGKRINFQTVMTWSVMTNDMVLPIGYRLLDAQSDETLSAVPKLFNEAEVESLKTLIGNRELTVYASSDLGENKSFLDYLDFQQNQQNKENKVVHLNYIVEVSRNFKVILFDLTATDLRRLKNEQRSVSVVAQDKLINDAKFFDRSRKTFQEVAWKIDENHQSSYFALIAVRTLSEEKQLVSHKKFLIIEWPLKEDMPTGYWLTNITVNSRGRSEITLNSLVGRIKRCTKKENIFDKLKDGYFLYGYHAKKEETFYHHAALSIISYVLGIK